MNVTVAVYQRRQPGGTLVWTTLGLGPHGRIVSGKSAVKLQKELSTQLRDHIASIDASELVHFELRRGTELRRVRLELALDGPDGKHKHSRIFPLILEPRFRTRTERTTVACHPDDQRSWFPVDPDRPLDDQARRFFQHLWRGRTPDAVEALATDGNDLVKAVAFRAKARSVLEDLPDREKGPFADLEMDLERTKGRKKKRRKKKSTTLLRRLGVNVTLRAADRSAPLGRPRSPIREQLQALLGGPRKTPVVVLGPPGAGKTTALHRFASDLLEADDYWTHRNLDLVHEVWRLSAKQIIAGMSFFGQWEERCGEIVREAMHEKIVLWIDDLHTFGRMGRSAGSDRSFADFFRGPLARGEIVLIGECSEEQWARLEDDAPAFADRFTRLRLEPTTPPETITLALHASRELETELQVIFDPLALRTLVDQSAALLRHAALPGTALELTRTLAREAATRGDGLAIEPSHVYAALSRRTGLPPALIDPAKKIAPDSLALELSRHVMGQPHAIEAAIDLVFRIRAGLTDTRRPYGTYLFTGPTGTGKTELAKALAGFLYGDTSRLVRFDMGEMSDYDAVARLTGDRFRPSGLLTTAVRQQPFSVILLDEIEKAHPLVLQLLLQLLDEGRLTDAAGDTADFTHAVIVMTSNLGTQSRSRVGFGESVESIMSDAIRAVRDFFPPELFNRIDRVVSFAPLDPATAGRIAEKELSRLLARRGLAERNVFVFAHEGAVRRMTERAFDSRDGARSVKRYLETEIGTLLAGELAKGSSASMRIVRILARDEGYDLHVSALVEAEPVAAEYELAGLTNAAASDIASRLPRALEIVKGLEEGAFAALAERLGRELESERWRESRAHADALYQLDVAREELGKLRDTLESHVGYGDEAEIERELAVDQKRPYVDPHDFYGYERSVRHLDRRWLAHKRTKIDRIEALRLVAEARFLERVIPAIESVDEHGCLLELLRVGQGRTSPGYSSDVAYGLLEWLAEFYAGFRGELVEMVARLEDGSIVDGAGALLRHPVQVVLKLSGLGMLAFFREEEGCHLWTSLLAGSDVVRVRALPAPPERSARDVIEEHLAATARFEASLDRGDPAPDPAALLPAVRKIRYEPPLRPESTTIEIEDYRMGLVESYNTPSLREALATLSFYRMSRVLR